MLITPEYRSLNGQLHSNDPNFGGHGRKWAPTIENFAKQISAKRILDYGAGKCTLALSLPNLPIFNYDPAIPGLDDDPQPADLLVSTDVMEHIEPECLDDVLDHMMALSLAAVFLIVATRPALKSLPDGRNAHLIQKRIAWWLPKLMSRWNVRNIVNMGGLEFMFVGESM